MKYLKNVQCQQCGQDFFILEESKISKENLLCNDCQKVEIEGLSDNLKAPLKDILSLYDDRPSKGRYKIEDI